MISGRRMVFMNENLRFLKAQDLRIRYFRTNAIQDKAENNVQQE
jgi:hypothetical protein